MTQYRISIERTAVRALAELDKPARRALVGRPGLLRLRVGDHRVIYEVHDNELRVLVVDLGHRGDIDR